MSDGGAVMHVFERELLITETGDGLIVWIQKAVSTISSLQIEGLWGLILGVPRRWGFLVFGAVACSGVGRLVTIELEGWLKL